MKAFQKLALVSAIAAAPFAQAELTSIDDAALSDMTGQAGISIELSAEVSVGSVVYTDTDGLGTLNVDNGSIALNTIKLGGKGGTAVSGALDGIKIDIDVDKTQGLVIHLGSTNEAGVLTGLLPVDFGLSVGDVTLAGGTNSAQLASDIYIGGNLGPVDVVIANDTGAISVEAFFEVTEGSMYVDVLGAGISNLKIGQDSSPFVTASLSNYGAAVKTSASAGDFGVAQDGIAAISPTFGDLSAIDADASGTIETSEWLTLPGLDGDADGTITVQEADTALAAGSGAIITSAAISAVPGVNNMAFAAMTITTATTAYTDKLGASTSITEALKINIDAMSMDISMDVALGKEAGVGRGIGNVAINDLDLTNTSLIIYGH